MSSTNTNANDKTMTFIPMLLLPLFRMSSFLLFEWLHTSVQLRSMIRVTQRVEKKTVSCEQCTTTDTHTMFSHCVNTKFSHCVKWNSVASIFIADIIENKITEMKNHDRILGYIFFFLFILTRFIWPNGKSIELCTWCLIHVFSGLCTMIIWNISCSHK